MSKPEYICTYKCRMCGETFKDAITGRQKAEMALYSYCDDGVVFRATGISEKTLHRTEDHIGIADLIGCKIEEDK